MTSAATGHAIQGRGKGWRKAVRYALTENPVSGMSHEPLPVFELQRHQVSEALPVPTAAPAERKAVRAPRRAKTKEVQPER